MSSQSPPSKSEGSQYAPVLLASDVSDGSCPAGVCDGGMVAGSVSPPAILVVDDDAGQRLAMRAILAPLGHTIIEAGSGRAALRAVGDQRFALILMDVRMPTLDGYETARLIRERSQTGLTPIIFVTASVEEYPQATATAYASGAVDFIFTPVHPDVLRLKVSTYVDLFVQAQQLQRSLESITALHAALRDTEARAHAVLQNVADGIVTVDGQGLIESFNRSARRLFGYREDEVLGHPVGLIVTAGRPGKPGGCTSAAAGLPVGRDSVVGPIATVGRRKDGSCFPIEVQRSAMWLGERTLEIDSIRDVSERNAQTEALGHQALHDALTGLPNRTLFADRVSQAVAAADRAGESRGVLVLDLDGFKQVNDTYGHDCGDTLLAEIARRLAGSLRETDTVARVGGDEFAILLDGPGDLPAAATAAWKMQQACESSFAIDHETVRVSTSVGIALFPEHGNTTAQLLHRADLAMYHAKRSGTSYAVYDAADEQQLAHSLALLADLRDCVAHDQLVVHYQPVIDVATHRTTGVEALVRWRHPTRGLLHPASFLPQAERTPLITPLTRWVLNDALRQQQAWLNQRIDVTIAVNVAAHTLKANSDLADTIAELTDTWESTPHGLTLELTESSLIEPAAPGVLARVHDMGGKVSIDDYGTGYSSLAYLQNLPVDQLKIDQSFIKNLATIKDNAVIVRSTIDLAHNLGMTVVAEGVEDEQALDILTEYGCDSAQGYLFSPGLTADQLTPWLTTSPYPAVAKPRFA
jgi:diguanylate cyclase (GGDEF)-like protein/PAS domain S-box-containing protein